MDSILTSIKKLLGIDEDYEHFDTDLIIHINTVLNILIQLGVGPVEGFAISDKTAEWTDFVGDYPNLEAVRTYTYLKVRLVFDPPTSSSAVQSIERCISELEWRINHTAEMH